MPRGRRRLLVVAAGTLVALLVAVGVLSRGSTDHACDAPEQAPPAELALLPDALSLDRVGQVTRVLRNRNYVNVFAVTAKPLDDVTVLIQDAVTAAGYRPAGMDNEGFEAEVFFTTKQFAAGQARIRSSACKGRWDIHLVLLVNS